MSPDELYDSFQDFLDGYGSRHRGDRGGEFQYGRRVAFWRSKRRTAWSTGTP